MERTHRFLLAVAALGLCAGCDSGGGGGSSFVLAGSVLSPAGQPIGLVAESGPRASRAPRRAGELELAGLLPVPDGTRVDLVRLDALGATLQSLASTTTAAGRYAFDLSSLGVALASDLAVTAGSGASRLRAPAVQAALDVDPVSEAALLALLQQGVGLAPFTVQEASDLLASAQLLATAQGLAAEADVAATVDLVLQAVLADPGLAGYLAAAGLDGETAAGPGDVGDYFPSTLGDTWSYTAELALEGQVHETFRRARRVVEATGLGAFAIEDSETSADDDSSIASYVESGTALAFLGSDGLADVLLQAVVPFDEARFPLRSGERWVQFDARNVPVGDLDFDGDPDFADLRSERELVSFEPVLVLGETLAGCARFDTTASTTVHLSSGSEDTSTLEVSEWFAPGRGLVATDALIALSQSGFDQLLEQSETLAAFQVGTTGHGALPGHELLLDLTQANSNQGEPGRPGVGFDGTNYLVVSCRSSSGVVGALVTPTGLVLEEFPILGAGSSCSPRAVVSFDGANYLVVFHTSGSPDLVGVRITPSGELLDPTGFPIAQSGLSNSAPAVVFDGANHLVLWNSFDSTLLHDIHGAFVAPDGTVSDEFVVHSAPGSQHSPALVQGGGQFLVVWVEGSFDSDLRGARLALDGGVLDPAGFDIATEPDNALEPAVSFDGERYLVVWTRDLTPSLTGADLLAARLELDGSPSDPAPLEVYTGDAGSGPAVVFDGANHYVVWEISTFQPPTGIHAARISPAGILLDGPASDTGFVIEEPHAFAQRLAAPALARGASNLLLCWVINAEVSGQLKGLAATQIYPPGR